MSNFMQRALTGIVFVAVVLGAVLWRVESFRVLIVLISALSLFEFLKLYKEQENKVNPYFGAITGGLILLVYAVFIGEFKIPALGLFIALSLCLLLYNLFALKKDVFSSAGLLGLGYLYFVYPFILLVPLVDTNEGRYNYQLLLYLLIVVWSNDTFAYLGGKTFGKHKLMPKISPNKTIEGFISGILFCGLASYLMIRFGLFENQIPWYTHIYAGIIFGTAATIGDLIQSAVKRMVGAKDSGNLLPGHGGIWDRFDGFIAVVWVYVFMVQIAMITIL
ncbi:MAG: phosphatidate cytidylyltransferase [Bacteroidetes bacterium]|nr:phosphatidate cytidylyltransferase [Bacteroidota bacterium]